MIYKFRVKKIILFFALSLIFIFNSGAALASDMENVKKAIELRNEALKIQNKGDYFGAMKVYAEAINIYPQYAQAYCDMGILYEAFGIKNDAEKLYLKALEIDPGCIGAYTNLALFYESTKDFSKAEFYWKKRVELGAPDDKWTQEAKKKLLALSKDNPAVNMEQQGKKVVIDNSNKKRKKEEEGIFKDKEFETKGWEFESLKQEIAALKEKRKEELFIKDQQLEKLNQQLSFLQGENEKKLSDRDKQIEILKQKVLYLQQQSRAEVVNSQKEVSKAAGQLADLIGSLKEDFSSWQGKDSPPAAVKQD